ncbi:hypothetical protein T01_6169 [Trichinella spiralis]|uniref:Uncharacterized protein n=1 Tax=Trichinella spiralis TaxID=6334 RepID=A0A0V1B683_TRISP|nr:hypothetical protein T01_6169 [Trichinella spiralis]
MRPEDCCCSMIQHFLKEYKMRMDSSDTKSPILLEVSFLLDVSLRACFSSSDGRAELTRAPVCDECLVKLASKF